VIFVQLGPELDHVSTRQYLQNSLYRNMNAESQIEHLKREVALSKIRGPKYKPTVTSPAIDIRTTARIMKMKAQFKKELAKIHAQAVNDVKCEVPIPKFTDTCVTDLLHALWSDRYETDVLALLDQDVGLIPALQLFLEKQRKTLAVPILPYILHPVNLISFTLQYHIPYNVVPYTDHSTQHE
jgi:hypothetical protein